MKLFYIFILTTLLFACAKEQPQVSWLIIEKWDLVANPNAENQQGELSHNLSQVFVNMDGKSLGTYELPAKIPIIGEGKHEFVLIPGIIVNGMSETKKRYPFAEQFRGEITLVLNDTVSIKPKTQYYSNLKFLIEDFESPSMSIEVSEQSSATLGRKNDPSILKWGNRYGEIILNDSDSLISFMTTFGKALPKFGSEVYLEFDYMNTNTMKPRVISYGNGEYYQDPVLITVAPQKEGKEVWKHMYLDLKEIISFRQNAPINEAEFLLMLDVPGTEKHFYIDNIKLIYP